MNARMLGGISCRADAEDEAIKWRRAPVSSREVILEDSGLSLKVPAMVSDNELAISSIAIYNIGHINRLL